MKKLSVLFVVGLFFLVGCATDQGQPQIQIDPEDKATIGKIAGRHAGNELAKRYPDIAVEVLALSEGLLVAEESEIIKVVLDRVVFVLSSEVISDKLLVMDIQDLVGMIRVQVDVEITEDQMTIIRAVAGGLIEGINLQEN